MTRVLEPGETITPIIRELGHSQECSGCSGQYPNLRYIDFDAAVDRGFYADNTIAKDDLVMCESCVLEAARLLGLEPVDEMKTRVASIELQLEDERKARRKAEEYTDRLEDAFQHRPKGTVDIDHRRKPRQRKPVDPVAA